MIKIAIIGAGKVAKNVHLPSWNKISNVSVVGVIDKDIVKARTFSKVNNIKYYSNSLVSLLKITNLDAVDICTSNKSHHQIIVDSLNRNLNVICEKPFTLKAKNIDEIIKLSQKNKLVCLSAQHQRFRLPSIKLKELMNKKKLGDIYSIHVECNFNYAEAIRNKNFYLKKLSGGGPLIDLGSHFIDLILWLLNNPTPSTVSCFTTSILSKNLKNISKINKNADIEDYSKSFIKFSKKLVLSLELSYLNNSNIEKTQEIILQGTKQKITWPKMISTKLLNKNSTHKIIEKKKASQLMLENFVNCIKYKKYSNKDLLIIKKSIKIIELLYRSAKIGKEVKFENF